MKSVIEDLNGIVNDLEYGNITKNDVVRKLELAIAELLENE